MRPAGIRPLTTISKWLSGIISKGLHLRNNRSLSKFLVAFMQYRTTLHWNLLIPWCLDSPWFASNSLIKIPASINGLRDLRGAATTLTSGDLRTSVVKANRDASARALSFTSCCSLSSSSSLFLLSERELSAVSSFFILYVVNSSLSPLSFLFMCMLCAKAVTPFKAHSSERARTAQPTQNKEEGSNKDCRERIMSNRWPEH